MHILSGSYFSTHSYLLKSGVFDDLLCMQAHVWAIFRIGSLTHLEVTFINFFFPSLFSGCWEFHRAICSIDGAKRTLELMNIEV